MYLDHFGLFAEPFALTTPIDFFYEGGGRGVTLDSLIYVLTHGEGVEGIIQITGEMGSGTTTLCRLLIRRLPAGIKTIHLAKPNLSREALFHSIADELKFNLSENCESAAATIVALCELQSALIEQHAEGRQVVLLLDEAHTIPAETLEALRLLYELESSRHKLLQIVLFGQTELKNTLALPQMRQFRDRVTHHFAMQSLNTKAVGEYLILRMRAAGYRGPDIFTPEAINLIALASGGFIQQINILADKSLLAAFTAHTHGIEAYHVRAAINDSGIKPSFNLRDWINTLDRRVAGGSAVLATVVLAVLGWQTLRPAPVDVTPTMASVAGEAITSLPFSVPVSSPAIALTGSTAPSAPSALSAPAPATSTAPTASTAPLALVQSGRAVLPASSGTAAGTIAPAQSGLAATAEQPSTRLDIGGVKLAGYDLLEQRVEATEKIMAATDKNYYSIQLFATENIQPDRMERFLSRAQNLVNLSDLYMHPVTSEGQAKFRVTYGIYRSREQASAAVEELPQKYKTSFHPELYTLRELR